MNILHITEAFSPLSETSIYNFIVALEREGHVSSVFTLKRLLEEQRPFTRVYPVTLPHKLHPARLAASTRRRMNLIRHQEQLFQIARHQLAHIVEAIAPDVIHAHFGPMGVLAQPVAEAHRIPLVVFFGGYDVTRIPLDKRWLRHYRCLSHGTAGIVCNSDFTKSRLEALGFRTEMIIRSIGIDLEGLTYGDPSKRFDGKRVECLFVGRLVEVKSPLPLISAFSMAQSALHGKRDLHLTIVGEGPLKQRALEQANDLGLMNHVHITGALPYGEVKTLFNRMHIYVQFNQRTETGEEETLGGTLLEASACGLPIVAVRSGGVTEAVLDGVSGFLVELDDVQGFANRLIELAMQPGLWSTFGLSGRKHVEGNFSLSNQVASTLALYESVASGSARKS